ncbi:MAG TPA: PAS domain S-box protein, partial [Clostridia bacterium]|nr:PAS domain S-box protein [Clostridia bacterium]
MKEVKHAPGRARSQGPRRLPAAGSQWERRLHSEVEARFRLIFDGHSAGMLLIDPESGDIVEANSAAAALYGYSQARLRGMNLRQLTLLPRAFKPQVTPSSTEYLAVPHRLANGETRSVEVYSSPVQVRGRHLLFSILHDVTGRKLLEKRLLDISDKERQRVGRDLHDSVGGKLTGAALMGKALAQRLASKSKIEAALAEEVVKCLNECIAQTRAIARGLCPIEMKKSGLKTALQQLAADTQRRTGIDCRFTSGRVQLQDRFVMSHLFRIAQEAVTNAVRHARPQRLELGLSRQDGQVLLEIQDDGAGLPERARRAPGLGLSTMQYRAELLGGQLTVQR